MNTTTIPLTGSPSYYCLTEQQLQDARRLAFDDPDSSARIQQMLETVENQLDRNQQAALAFVLIDRLLQSRD